MMFRYFDPQVCSNTLVFMFEVLTQVFVLYVYVCAEVPSVMFGFKNAVTIDLSFGAT